ncbi:gluconolactonase [Mycolicibacterium parafortuitum]|uniref:Gluconolactonase n=1 Tax=Mycolicibacterium parafortuitum TaxID=39692 RepID=A0A7I7UB10_MYCPF|nr:gluconolactonase [Mycolicibacterium parafortuitum]
MADGFCFGEGPRWFEGLVWFSDMLGEAVHTVTLDREMSTLALPGHAPSGLGFRPDGTLLIVSTERRQILGYDGESVVTVADLADVVPAALGDMVIDRHGCAYVGSQAREGGLIVRVDASDGTFEVVAGDLEFPNGMVLTPDGTTLIVAESTGRRLTAFDVADDGMLGGRRVFADGLDGPPDGICLDDDGGVWVGMTLAHQFERIVEGGEVTDRIDIGERTAIACALGGPEGRTLFLVTTPDAYPDRVRGTLLSRLDATTVDVPAAGFVADAHLH